MADKKTTKDEAAAGPADAAAASGTTASPEEIASGQFEAPDEQISDGSKADAAPAGPADAASDAASTASPEEIASGVPSGADEPQTTPSVFEGNERTDISTGEDGQPIDPDKKPEEPQVEEPQVFQEVDEDGWNDDERKIIEANKKNFDEQKEWAEANRKDDPNNQTETNDEYNARITGAKGHFYSS